MGASWRHEARRVPTPRNTAPRGGSQATGRRSRRATKTPKDESTTTRTGNQVEILYTEHRFQRGEDGTIRRVE
ncbi:MAG: hypothetical protein R3B99_29865 [Polyangiales bacterium]